MLKYDAARLRIVDYIRRSGLRAGDPIPSQATLVKYCNCSLITVKRALSDLRKAGLIECGQGRTARLVSTPDIHPVKTAGTILMIQIYRRYPDTEEERFLLEMYLAERGFGFRFQAVMMPSDLAGFDYTGIKGIILYGWISEEWVDLVKSLKIPAVVVGNNPLPDRIPTVSIDYKQGTRLLFDELRNAGCRKIALISGDLNYVFHRQIRESWLECMKEAGFADPSGYSFAMPPHGTGGVDQALADFLHSTDADGFIMHYPVIIVRVLTHLFDLEPPRRFKFGLFYSDPQIQPRRNSFFVRSSVSLLSAAADELIAARMEMRPVRSKTFPMKLYPIQTNIKKTERNRHEKAAD